MHVTKLACLWPGLPRLWFRGEVGGLLAACGFAAAVNLLLVTGVLWPEVAPPVLRAVGLFVAAIWWLLSLTASLRQFPQFAAGTDDDPHKGLFVTAQGEYLKGSWIEAEALLRKLLRHRSRDCEALLLLAALYRRTGRIDEARLQLQNLARLEASSLWQLEIRTERELLRRRAERNRLEELSSAENPFDDTMVAERRETGANDSANSHDSPKTAPNATSHRHERRKRAA